MQDPETISSSRRRFNLSKGSRVVFALIFLTLSVSVVRSIRNLNAFDFLGYVSEKSLDYEHDTTNKEALDDKHDNKEALINDPLRRLQAEVDDDDPVARCKRYGWEKFDSGNHRKIYYGSLIADESWELLEIVAGEARGIFEGMVFVESNRTQMFIPRQWKHFAPSIEQTNQHIRKLKDLFQTNHVQIRTYINETNSQIKGLARENYQRQLILEGWKELGMKPNDIGYIADVDETFNRDVFRAVQTCDNIPFLNYEKHQCKNEQARNFGKTRVFETSPECSTKDRSWYHPDLVMGACIEGIGNSSIHPIAPRHNIITRKEGYGGMCNYSNITNGHYPLWNAGDFRMACGGTEVTRNVQGNDTLIYDRYTAYHFHNFQTHFNVTRFKYRTYGHPVDDAEFSPIPKIAEDLELMYNCVKNLTDNVNATYKYTPGGFKALRLPLPLYFIAYPEYRRRRHNHVKQQLKAEEVSKQANQTG